MTLEQAPGMCGVLVHCYTPMIVVFGVLRARDGAVVWRKVAQVTTLERRVPKHAASECTNHPDFIRHDVGIAARIGGAPLPATVARTEPPAVESVPAGPVSGTYRGTVSGDQEGRAYSTQITVTLAEQGDQITGTWLTVGGASGTITGRLISPNRMEIQVQQLHPCRATFTGAATVGEAGSSLGGSYTGTGCAGPVSTSFTAIRQ